MANRVRLRATPPGRIFAPQCEQQLHPRLPLMNCLRLVEWTAKLNIHGAKSSLADNCTGISVLTLHSIAADSCTLAIITGFGVMPFPVEHARS